MYDYVPVFFQGDKKLYEAQPEESYGETKYKIKAVFDKLVQ